MANADSQLLQALSRSSLYTRFQFADFFGSSLWLGFQTLFLIEGLGCSMVQVGIILGWSLIAQVFFEVPSGVVGDSIGHARSVFLSFLCLALYPCFYMLLFFINGDSLDVATLLGCLLAESVFAAGVALQSGSIETWASEPIRKLARTLEGREDRQRLAEECYGVLEARAKRGVSAGLLLGGTAGLLLVAAFSFLSTESKAGSDGDPASWALVTPWCASFIVYVAVLWYARLLPRQAGTTVTPVSARFMEALSRVRRDWDRIMALSVHTLRRQDAGPPLLRLFLLNSVVFVGIYLVQSYWAVALRSVLNASPIVLSNAQSYVIMAIAWAAISFLAIAGGSSAERIVRTRDPAARTHQRVLWTLAFLFLLIAILLKSGSHLPVPLTVGLLLAILAAAKFLEGVTRPLVTAAVAHALPDSSSRATVLSLEGWVRAAGAGVLFVLLGVVSARDLALLWIFAGVLLGLTAAMASWMVRATRISAPLITYVVVLAGAAATLVQFTLTPDFTPVRLESAEAGQYTTTIGIAESQPEHRARAKSREIVISGEGAGTAIELPAFLEVSRPFPLPESDVKVSYSWTGVRDRRLDSTRLQVESQLPLMLQMGSGSERRLSVESVSVDGVQVPIEWVKRQDQVLILVLFVVCVVVAFLLARAFLRDERRLVEIGQAVSRLRIEIESRDWRATAGHDRPEEPIQHLRRDLRNALVLLGIDAWAVAIRPRRGLARDQESDWYLVDGGTTKEASPAIRGAERSWRLPDQSQVDGCGFLEFDPDDDAWSDVLATMGAGEHPRLNRVFVGFEGEGRSYHIDSGPAVFFGQIASHGISVNERAQLRELTDLIQHVVTLYDLYFRLGHGERSNIEALRLAMTQELGAKLGPQRFPVELFWAEKATDHARFADFLARLHEDYEVVSASGAYQPTERLRETELPQFLEFCSRCAIAQFMGETCTPTDRFRVEINWNSADLLLRSDRDHALLEVWGLLRNLLHNGLRHGSGHVSVRVKHLDGSLQFKFVDRGLGISPPEWEQRTVMSVPTLERPRPSGGLWIAADSARRLGASLELILEDTSRGWPTLLWPVSTDVV